VQTKSSEETERALREVLSEEYLMLCNELMVRHGQTICRPRGPRCPQCPVVETCAHAAEVRKTT